MTNLPSFETLRVDIENDIATLTFDAQGKMNVLAKPVLQEFERAIEVLGTRPTLQGLVLASAKDDFIVGADIHAMKEVLEAKEGERISLWGQRVFGMLKTLPFPTVAAIHGSCLGGGLEMALACDVRIVTDSPRTRLGLPEIQLGLVPGWGGTQRLSPLCGIGAALDLILTGRKLDANRAKRLGIADEVVRPAVLLQAARKATSKARAIRNGRKLAWYDRFIRATPPLRAAFFAIARKKVAAKSRGHYPAPLRALGALEEGLKRGEAEGLLTEARALGDLIVSPESRELVRLFELMEGQKRKAREEADQAFSPTRGAVVGAGVMGAGIASLAVNKGIRMRLRDVAWPPLAQALSTLSRDLKKRVRQKRIQKHIALETVDRLEPTVTLDGFQKCAFVIEAATERLDLKKEIVKEIEACSPKDALIATNTSSLVLDDISTAMQSPDRLVGLHFFNPVAKMPLIEIVRAEGTRDSAVAQATSLALSLGKIPIVVTSTPGFLVNRILAPYLNESARILLEGTPMAKIDSAMRGFGWPMGPFQLLDEVGLDVAREVGKVLESAFGDRMKAPPLLEDLVSRGALGKKKGRGFYDHGRRRLGRRRPSKELGQVLASAGAKGGDLTSEEIVERTMMAMLNEVAHCLDEGVVDSMESADLASLLGLGFPPFRGGVMRYAQYLGFDVVLEKLRKLQALHGSRFTPCSWFADRNVSSPVDSVSKATPSV